MDSPKLKNYFILYEVRRIGKTVAYRCNMDYECERMSRKHLDLIKEDLAKDNPYELFVILGWQEYGSEDKSTI